MVVGLLPLLQLVSQTTQSDPEQFGAAVGFITGFLVVALLFAHISGKIAQSAGGNYWLFAICGFFTNLLGVLFATIYYVGMKMSRDRPREAGAQGYYQQGYPQQPPVPYQQPGYPPQPPVQYQQPGYPQMPPPPQPVQAQPPQAAFPSPQPTLQSPAAAGPAPVSGMRKCGGCGADNPQVASKCWRCEKELGLVPAGRTCYQCNSVQPEQAEFCTVCGARLSPATG
jgi:ribosomal protein L40E